MENVMKYDELDRYWQRIFKLEWISLCERSKAIAAIIIDADGNVISEGRNKIGENHIPNPRVQHAEVEAIRNLDIEKKPYVKTYTLFTSLEPCPMCMGTIVMGGIRNVVIGTHDQLGGAMGLIEHSNFLKSKNIKVTWMPEIYGDIQRGLQAIKELLYNEDSTKLQRMMDDFSVYNKKGVIAAKQMVDNGMFSAKAPSAYSIEEIFNILVDLIDKAE